MGRGNRGLCPKEGGLLVEVAALSIGEAMRGGVRLMGIKWRRIREHDLREGRPIRIVALFAKSRAPCLGGGERAGRGRVYVRLWMIGLRG